MSLCDQLKGAERESALIIPLICFFSGEDENEEDENEAEQPCESDNKEDQTYDQTGIVSAGGEGSVNDEDEPLTTGSPSSDEILAFPMSNNPSSGGSPAQSEPTQTHEQQLLSNGRPARLKEPVSLTNQLSVVLVRDNQVIKDAAGVRPTAAAGTNGDSLAEQGTVGVGQCESQTTNGTSPPPSPRTTRSQKRKREEKMSENSKSVKQKLSYDR